MGTGCGSSESCGDAVLHEIRVQGQLDNRWADTLGMNFRLETGGITALTGPLMDQSALHGLLARLRDLGLPIISLRRICTRTNTGTLDNNEGQA